MSDVLEDNVLERWRREPISFIEEVLRNPETGKPFELSISRGIPPQC